MACCVPGCKNDSRKGFSLRRFPSNEERKAIWALKIGRKNWKPSPYSQICEVHFAEDMWEKPRIDGKRKLKHNAMPTIFPAARKEKENEENPYTINHFQGFHKIFMSDTSKESCAMQSYEIEDPLQIDTEESSIKLHLDTTVPTSTSNIIDLTTEPPLTKLEVLQRKLKVTNEKLQIANAVVRKGQNRLKLLKFFNKKVAKVAWVYR